MSLQDYIIEKPVIDTEHLILRTMDKNDIDDLKEWISDISLYEYWGNVLQKAKKIQKYSLVSQKKLLKVFIGELSINKIAK